MVVSVNEFLGFLLIDELKLDFIVFLAEAANVIQELGLFQEFLNDFGVYLFL